jgi:anti-sigma regulatory factor (Ser/Thr protein kinase)
LYPTDIHESNIHELGQNLSAPSCAIDATPCSSREYAVEVSSDPQSLERIRLFVESACRQLISPPLCDEQTRKMIIAAREVATSIIHHAYHGRADGTIRLEAEVARDRLTIRLWHRGEDFDPGLVAEPPLDGSRVGRFGVYMASQYTGKVQYFSDGRGVHCLSLITDREPDAATPTAPESGPPGD